MPSLFTRARALSSRRPSPTSAQYTLSFYYFCRFITRVVLLLVSFYYRVVLLLVSYNARVVLLLVSFYCSRRFIARVSLIHLSFDAFCRFITCVSLILVGWCRYRWLWSRRVHTMVVLCWSCGSGDTLNADNALSQGWDVAVPLRRCHRFCTAGNRPLTLLCGG